MAKFAPKTAFTVGLLVVLLSLPAFGASINKSVKIADGESSDGATSVNGSITVGDNAVVTGGLTTVNGTIRVGSGATIENAKTVNGRISIGDGVESGNLTTVNGSMRVGAESSVDGDITAVNGSITVKKGSSVSGNIENVNGGIELVAASAGGDLSTVNGNVSLDEGSILEGDLIVEKPNNWGWNKKKGRKPRIVIGPGSRVEGTIELEHEVELYISDSAEVGGVSGVMSLDDAIRFSGDSP